jgi:hypothetical protein
LNHRPIIELVTHRWHLRCGVDRYNKSSRGSFVTRTRLSDRCTISAGKRRKNEARKEKAAWRRPLESCASTPVPIAEHIVDRHGAPMRWRFASPRATSRDSQS